MRRERDGLEQTGVLLLLSPNINIPEFVRNSRHSTIGRAKIGDQKEISFVRISIGGATFVGGGSVILDVPGNKRGLVGFGPNEVLAICTIEGEVIKRNHHLCTNCLSNTGQMVGYNYSLIAGKVDGFFQCTQCNNQWELKNI